MKSPAILVCLLVVLLPFISADAETEKKNEINFERSQDVLTLNCSLTNNPDKVEWSKDGQKLEMAAGEGGVMQLKDREAVTFTHNSGANVHALNVRKPKVTDVGNYVCSSVGSEDVESEKFNVLMPTIIQKIVALNNIIDGEELLLTCNVIGNPPAEISWFKVPEPESKDLKDTWMSMDSKVKIENDTRITITSSGMHTTMSSVLNIKDITLEDRFVYMCLADNQMVDNGVATNSTILIRVVGKYAALWPFLGICAEVIVLCTVIFIYEKRRGNKKFDEDGDQSSS